ncbi:MAG: hypothetical protein HQK58_05890 [Deltaproteobacteria bacterium]|nr:hypothetical protein [Deltaproteobacteria bacterium]
MRLEQLRLTISFIVTITLAFIGATVFTLRVVQNNNEHLVSVILSEFDKYNKDSLKNLQKGVDRTAVNLKTADQKTKEIVLELYDVTYQRLIQSLANQIYPLIENFDYESAGRIMSEATKNDKEVTWISFQTSDRPAKSDIFEFGAKLVDTSQQTKAFIWKNREGAAYLKIDMQIRLTGLESISKIREPLAKLFERFFLNLVHTQNMPY